MISLPLHYVILRSNTGNRNLKLCRESPAIKELPGVYDIQQYYSKPYYPKSYNHTKAESPKCSRKPASTSAPDLQERHESPISRPFTMEKKDRYVRMRRLAHAESVKIAGLQRLVGKVLCSAHPKLNATLRRQIPNRRSLEL